MNQQLRRGTRGLAAMILVVGAAGAAACSAAPKSGETLAESVRTYNDGIRWQRYAVAAGRLPPAERSAFVDEWDARSEDLKITDYEIVDVVARGDRALVQVKISWYGDREGTLHDTHARQTWQRRGKIWLLTDEVRLRGHEMPGLAEPAPEQEPELEGRGAPTVTTDPSDGSAATSAVDAGPSVGEIPATPEPQRGVAATAP